MKIYKNISLFVFSLIALSSCYKDLGNYEYSEVPEVTVTGMSETYSAVSNKGNFIVDPKVTIKNGSVDQLEYLWTAYKSVLDERYVKLKIDTISTKLNIDSPVTLPSGTYKLWLRVRNKATGRDVYAESSLLVSTRYATGFYLLKENAAGDSDLDFFDADDKIIPNVITANTGSALKGKPFSLTQLTSFAYLDAKTGQYDRRPFITVVTDEDLGMFRLDDMALIRKKDDLYYTPPGDNGKPLFFIGNRATISFYTTKGYQYDYQGTTGIGSIGKFGTPYYADALGYELAPYISPARDGQIMWDVKNARAIGINSNGVLAISPDIAGLPYKFVYMGSNVGTGSNTFATFVVLKHATDPEPARRYLMELRTSTAHNGYAGSRVSLAGVATTPKFVLADSYETCKVGVKTIYFMYEGKLHMMNPAQKTEEELIIEGLPAGEEITFYDTIFNMIDTKVENQFNYLVIATHNAGRYTVRMYNTVGGKPTGAPVKTYSGEGKVVKINHVDPIQVTSDANRNKMSLNY